MSQALTALDAESLSDALDHADVMSPFERQKKVSGNQKRLIALVGISSMLEFWDTYLIGFIMAFLFKSWHLTFGTMSTVLLASGVGAIVGALFWGAVADRIGRKPVFVACLIVSGLGCLALAFAPEGDWKFMAILRVVIGFGTGTFYLNAAMVQEFLPPQRRGQLTAIVATLTTGGLLLGTLCGAFVIPHIGWRATFGLGVLTAVLGIVAAFWMPESPRWLLLNGRREEAVKSVRWALPAGDPVLLPTALPVSRSGNFWEIFRYPRQAASVFLINLGLVTGYYGIALWGPTLISQIEGVTPATASTIMVGFSLAGVLTRLLAALLIDRAGRCTMGGLYACLAAAGSCIAGLVGHGIIAQADLFWVPLLLGFAFADGGFAISPIYSTEIWPSRVRSSGSGFGNAAGNLGKVTGPLGLALIAGSSNLIMPAATTKAIVPSFMLLAGALLVAGLAYLVLGVDVRDHSLEALDEVLEGGDAVHARAPALRTREAR